MQSGKIFQKIISKEIPACIVYQDKKVTAFKDIKPKAPIHIIIIPNILIKSANDVLKKHNNILGHMMNIAIKIAKLKKINEEGYRIILNCNKNGGQEVKYLHIHLLGGGELNKFL